VLPLPANPSELPLLHSEISKHPLLIPLLRSNISNSQCVLEKKKIKMPLKIKGKRDKRERKGLRKVLRVFP